MPWNRINRRKWLLNNDLWAGLNKLNKVDELAVLVVSWLLIFWRTWWQFVFLTHFVIDLFSHWTMNNMIIVWKSNKIQNMNKTFSFSSLSTFNSTTSSVTSSNWNFNMLSTHSLTDSHLSEHRVIIFFLSLMIHGPLYLNSVLLSFPYLPDHHRNNVNYPGQCNGWQLHVFYVKIVEFHRKVKYLIKVGAW